MIGRIPPKRRDGKSSFLKLVSYVVFRVEDKPDMPLEPEHPDWRRPKWGQFGDRKFLYVKRIIWGPLGKRNLWSLPFLQHRF